MSLNEARSLRDEIKLTNIHCVVPRQSERGYFARIHSSRATGSCQPVDFYSRDEWLAWKKEADRQDLAATLKSRPRSPIEMMIDKACGIE